MMERCEFSPIRQFSKLWFLRFAVWLMYMHPTVVQKLTVCKRKSILDPNCQQLPSWDCAGHSFSSTKCNHHKRSHVTIRRQIFSCPKKFLPSNILGFLSVNQVHGDFTQWLCQSGAVGLSLSIERHHKFLVSHAKCFIHMTPRPSTKALLPCGPPAAIQEKIECPRQDMVVCRLLIIIS